ncbi:ATP-binding cassette domain-containing protein [Ruixingdingia sedimenti]|uniref:ATP-binding cassette domain-containing protein n=1 Tax=Ruixingdingia sedimenti TaxID=3073604 RepID=A0ABU1F845_9RHOB|nr:ATP-binding cassette domain-containing protein [Xinfangfangia sp. LG-4]MDR5653050.1 ATP-binding cassette domain-containing protein [Xinfangfangia sp. LG-4]
MLGLEGLRVGAGDFALTADWPVPAGARVAVIGPSGAGKSTLLLAIAGFLPAAAGRVTWQGRDLGPLAPGDRPLSILFQDQNLFPHLTLAQNVGLGLSPALRLTAGDHARVAQVLARVGLAGREDARPGQLSGGEQGRAALARVLLRARPTLLLDEPFAALGPGLKAEMLALVEEIADETGALVLMVTHDPADARRFAPLTVLVERGVAHPPVETAALFADPPPALRDYLGL